MIFEIDISKSVSREQFDDMVAVIVTNGARLSLNTHIAFESNTSVYLACAHTIPLILNWGLG